MGRAAERSSEVFRVLARPGRLRVALALCRSEEASARELASLLGQQPPYVTRQLAALRGVGLVDCRRVGRRVLYRPSDPQLCAMLATAQLVASGLSADRPGRRR